MKLRVFTIVAGATIAAMLWTVPSGPGMPFLGTQVAAQADQPTIYVIGNVARPGAYPYKDRMTVQAALELSGGVRDSSQAPLLIRTVDGKPTRIRTTPETVLNAQDTLFIPEER